MNKTTYQQPELRDSSNNVIQNGAYGKNSAFCNAQNTGILDYINNNLEALHDTQTQNTANISGKVNKSGDTMTGGLVIQNGGFALKNTNADVTTSTANYCYTDLNSYDKNNKRFAMIRFFQNGTNKGGGINVFDTNNTTKGTLAIYCRGDNDVYTEAPTPAATDNSTKIATTAFVNGGNIYESGTNYIRYASGLQICWGQVEVNITTVNTNVGWGYTFDKAFASIPICVCSLKCGWIYDAVGGLEGIGATKISGYVKHTTNVTNIWVEVFAIGRWK